jgi:hypothetical protein
MVGEAEGVNVIWEREEVSPTFNGRAAKEMLVGLGVTFHTFMGAARQGRLAKFVHPSLEGE